MRRRRGTPKGSQFKGPPSVVEAVRIREARAATRCTVWGVSALHPKGKLWHSCLDGNGEATHASQGA